MPYTRLCALVTLFLSHAAIVVYQYTYTHSEYIFWKAAESIVVDWMCYCVRAPTLCCICWTTIEFVVNGYAKWFVRSYIFFAFCCFGPFHILLIAHSLLSSYALCERNFHFRFISLHAEHARRASFETNKAACKLYMCVCMVICILHILFSPSCLLLEQMNVRFFLPSQCSWNGFVFCVFFFVSISRARNHGSEQIIPDMKCNFNYVSILHNFFSHS